MIQDTDQLLARSQAAIAEARRLVEINWQWQARIAENLDLMFLRNRFDPATARPAYPQDFDAQQPSSPRSPAQSDDA